MSLKGILAAQEKILVAQTEVMAVKGVRRGGILGSL
jgi:hypothetical protein